MRRHPSQVYQFLLEGVLFFFLLWFYAKKPRKTGQVAAVFLILYGVFRFSESISASLMHTLAILRLVGRWGMGVRAHAD